MHYMCQRNTFNTQVCAATPPQVLRGKSLSEGKVDSEADMLSGISRKRNAHSRYYWFTEFCNSQCSSHFAAPFIGIRAKTSIAESCKIKIERTSSPMNSLWKKDEIWQGGSRGWTQGISPCPTPEALDAIHRGNRWYIAILIRKASQQKIHSGLHGYVRMILPQVHLRKPCYDFSFL